MLRTKLATVAAVVLLAVGIWLLAGCGGSSNGEGRIQIFLRDTPLNATEINVSIASVQVHKAGGGWFTLKEYAPALEVDLLDYATGGNSLLLADCPLDEGHYTMVRLMLSDAVLVIGGEVHEVDLTNVAETGIKCNGQFTVEDDQLMALVVDFNANQSFVDTGGGIFMLHPVMTMSPVDIAAEVTGDVEFQDGSGGALPLPANVVVNFYFDGHAGDPAFLAASVAVETDGTFEIEVIAQGTYDVQILQDGTVVKTIEDVLMDSAQEDLDTFIVPPPAP